MGGALLFIGLIFLIMIGVPVGYAIGLATICTLAFFTDIPLLLVVQNCFTGLNSFVLLAIPFFVLAGVIMGAGGIAKRLVNIADSIIGSVSGGLGMAAVMTATFFGAITGSGNATTSAVGSLLIPSMAEKGYEKPFSSALVAAAGSIGIIIPPSIAFVIYGVTTSTSISDLFLAGIIPGIMMCIALMTACYLISKRKGYGGSDTKPSIKNIVQSIKGGFWAVLAPVIILGGIYTGVFTPTESAVVAVVYSIVISCFIYKELSLKGLIKCIYDAAVINGITSFIVGFSASMAKYVTMENIPNLITEAILQLTDNKILILFLINIFLLIVGMLIDIIPAIIILSPILLPVVVSFGMSPVQFGLIISMNLGIGFITPPYGSTLFVASAISKVSVEKMFGWAFIFAGILIIVLMLITYVPWFSLVLIS